MRTLVLIGLVVVVQGALSAPPRDIAAVQDAPDRILENVLNWPKNVYGRANNRSKEFVDRATNGSKALADRLRQFADRPNNFYDVAFNRTQAFAEQAANRSRQFYERQRQNLQNPQGGNNRPLLEFLSQLSRPIDFIYTLPGTESLPPKEELLNNLPLANPNSPLVQNNFSQGLIQLANQTFTGLPTNLNASRFQNFVDAVKNPASILERIGIHNDDPALAQLRDPNANLTARDYLRLANSLIEKTPLGHLSDVQRRIADSPVYKRIQERHQERHEERRRDPHPIRNRPLQGQWLRRNNASTISTNELGN